jgi:hypothetical protein
MPSPMILCRRWNFPLTQFRHHAKRNSPKRVTPPPSMTAVFFGGVAFVEHRPRQEQSLTRPKCTLGQLASRCFIPIYATSLGQIRAVSNGMVQLFAGHRAIFVTAHRFAYLNCESGRRFKRQTGR